MKRVLFILIIISFFSCRKSDRDIDNTLNSVEDNSLAESAFSHIFKLIDAAAKYNRGISSNTILSDTSLFGCDKITVDTSSFPKKIIIDFSSSCKGKDIEHSGKISAQIYGKYNEIGTISKINFTNFKFNGKLVGGSLTITNKGLSANGNQLFDVEVSNGTLSGNKSNLTWHCNRIWEMNVGQASSTVADDSYLITGTAEGRAFKGNAFTVEITEPLLISNSCIYVMQGKCNVKPENLHTRRTDYGNGTCDAQADVDINGKKYEVSLP